MRKQAIEKVLESWFVRENGHLSIRNEFLRAQCWTLIKRYGQDVPFDEFACDYLSKSFDVLQAEGLKLSDKQWLEAYEQADTHMNVFNEATAHKAGKQAVKDGSALSKISGYLYSSLPFVYLEEFQKSRSIRVRNGTKNGYTVIEFDLEHLDGMVQNGEENDYTADTLTENNSLYVDDDYIMSHFQIWYVENKEKLLTEKQMSFLKGWIKADLLDSTEAERVEATGIDRKNHNYYLKSIAKNILKGYNKEKPLQNTSYQLQLKRFVDLVQPLNDIHESKNLDTMNEKMLDYIHRHYSVLQSSLKLTALEHQQMNRKEFNNQTLYKIFNQLQDKCERYQAIIAELESVIDEDLVQYKVPSTTINHFENIEKGAKYARIIGKDGYAVTIEEYENEN